MNRIIEQGTALKQRIENAAAAISSCHRGAPPETALILGTGLGAVVDEISDAVTLPYGEIPGFPVSTAPGHEGQ
jgi:purine-nucleoside phosphorylase